MGIVIAALVIYFVLQVVCRVGVLWAAIRLCGVKGVRVHRFILLILAMAILAEVGVAAKNLQVARSWVHSDPVFGLAFVLSVLLLLVLACSTPLVSILLSIPWRRALAVSLVHLLLLGAVLLPSFYVLRTYVFELFKMPTGSMAPTLLGVHTQVTCDNCGCCYDVNASERELFLGQPQVTSCPVCRHRGQVASRSPVSSGDRFLVDRTCRPRRWDIVAFYYPEEPDVLMAKRLVGLPGEKVELLGGDVFINGQRKRKEPGTAEDLWILVHDGSHRPKQRTPECLRWEPETESSRWREIGEGWTFDGAEADVARLEFRGEITDALAYNLVEQTHAPEPAPCGDLKIDCVLDDFQGHGSLTFDWRFAERQATATISAHGQVSLCVEDTTSATKKRDEVHGHLSSTMKRGRRLTFAVRDGQAYLSDDDVPVVRSDVGPQDADTVRQQVPARPSPCRLSLTARNCRVSLSRLAVYKDVFYRKKSDFSAQFGGKVKPVDRPCQLGPDAYYFLGDNSMCSKDSRFWDGASSHAIVGVVRCIYLPPERSRILP